MKIGVQPVALCRRLHDGLEVHGVICRAQGVRIAKVDFVLSRPLLVVGALREDPHVEERQADLPPYVLPAVFGRDVHVAGAVKRLLGGVTVCICLEEVEFKFRSDLYGQSHLRCPFRRAAEDEAGVPLKRRAVRVAYVAEHTHHLTVGGTPWQNVQRRGDGEEEEIGLFYIAETAYGGGIE